MRWIARQLCCAAALLLAGAAQADNLPPALQLSLALDPPQAEAPAAEARQAPLPLQLTPDMRDSIIRKLVLSAGHDMIGTDYELGANSSEAVDCSALVQQMFGSAGIELPRTARELSRIGKPVAGHPLAAGDLLFYRWGKRGLHVAVYMEGGRILHASPSAHGVVISALNAAWQRRLVTARRVM